MSGTGVDMLEAGGCVAEKENQAPTLIRDHRDAFDSD
jgi:hypothetical protein